MSGRNTVTRPGRAAGTLLAALLIASASLTPGCYSTQLVLLRSGLDSLRAQVDTMQVRDSVAFHLLADTRGELQQQRDLILSTRASSGSTMSEMFDQMSALQGRLDEVLHRFTTIAERASTGASAAAPATPSTAGAVPVAPPGPGPDPVLSYDNATRDLTEGRYGMALQGYREFLKRFGASELADNAQYGAGECFFAQAVFDSASLEYARVGEMWPKGDRAAAALYKLALCQERLGRAADSRRSLEDLIKRFPSSSEAGLAKDRLGSKK